MRNKLGIALVVLLLLPVGGAAAQQRVRRHAPMGAELDFRLPESGLETVPFEVVNNHILLPVSVNGSEPFRLILDTGMPMSGAMLYGTERVKQMKLPVDPSMRAAIGGAGGDGKRMEADIVAGQSLSIGALKIEGASLVVMPPLHGLAGYHDGVIGRGLFANSVVEVNYDEKIITFHEPKRYEAPAGAAELPITFQHGIPYAKGSVTTVDGSVVPLDLVLDIGASHAVSLNTDSDDRIRVPDGAVETVLGRGVGGEVLGHVGRVKSFSVAGQTFDNVVASFPESRHQSPRGMDSRNGNLGSGILGRFNVAFDYANERFLLIPNQSIREPFEFDMSGLRFDAGDLRVKSVLPDSPAARAGLQSDDVVVAVDGRDASEIGFFELREMLKQPGRELELELRRGSQTVSAKLTLRRLV